MLSRTLGDKSPSFQTKTHFKCVEALAIKKLENSLNICSGHK